MSLLAAALGDSGCDYLGDLSDTAREVLRDVAETVAVDVAKIAAVDTAQKAKQAASSAAPWLLGAGALLLVIIARSRGRRRVCQ